MISVIVPVFGVEPFLDECILSLLRQSYEDLEIILVDDGSPDCCGKICDHYAAIDKRIRVIHKNNGGLSDARNAGIDIARGEYIGFIDSDDYVSRDMFAYLLSLMEDMHSDISICGHVKTTYRGKHRPLWNHNKVYVMDSQEALDKMLQFGYYESFVWNKLFKRELFETIRFPYGKLHEDLFTTYKTFDKAERIAYSRDVKYFYRQRSGSLVHSADSSRYNDYVSASLEVRDFIELNYPAILPTASIAYFAARAFTAVCRVLTRPSMHFNRQKRREGLYRYVRAILSSFR